jgi:hypothetical protein
MAWRKAWIDTRWRFFIGLAIAFVAVCGAVAAYGEVQRLLPQLESANLFGTEGRVAAAISEAIEAQRTFRGYIWYSLFADNFTSLGVLFAALLGTGSPLSGAGRGLLFSLALPATRTSWLTARAGTGLAELFVLTLVPSLGLPLFASLFGQHYGFVDSVVHGGLLFVGTSVFFAAALLLGTLFNDVWRPVLITCFGAMVWMFFEQTLLPNGYGLFGVMSGAPYHETGSVPWIGAFVDVALTAALIYLAATHLAKRDF